MKTTHINYAFRPSVDIAYDRQIILCIQKSEESVMLMGKKKRFATWWLSKVCIGDIVDRLY